MKRLRAILGMMMLVLLFGVTSGFNLFTHLCLMTGEEGTAPVSMAMDCCGKPLPEAPVTLSMNCCIEEVHFIKFDFNGAVQSNLHLDSFIAIDTPIFLPKIAATNDHSEEGAKSLPPPLPGTIRDMQCIYRI